MQEHLVLLAEQAPGSCRRRWAHLISALAALLTTAAAVTDAAGIGPPTTFSRDSWRNRDRGRGPGHTGSTPASRRNRWKSRSPRGDGPLAVTPLGTPLSRSTQSRSTTSMVSLFRSGKPERRWESASRTCAYSAVVGRHKRDRGAGRPR